MNKTYYQMTDNELSAEYRRWAYRKKDAEAQLRQIEAEYERRGFSAGLYAELKAMQGLR